MGLQVKKQQQQQIYYVNVKLTLLHRKITVTLPSLGKWVTGLYMTQTWVPALGVMGKSGMRCQLSASDLTPS